MSPVPPHLHISPLGTESCEQFVDALGEIWIAETRAGERNRGPNRAYGRDLLAQRLADQLGFTLTFGESDPLVPGPAAASPNR